MAQARIWAIIIVVAIHVLVHGREFQEAEGAGEAAVGQGHVHAQLQFRAPVRGTGLVVNEQEEAVFAAQPDAKCLGVGLGHADDGMVIALWVVGIEPVRGRVRGPTVPSSRGFLEFLRGSGRYPGVTDVEARQLGRKIWLNKITK